MAVEITEELVWQSIPRRARDSHKGTFGSVLAVAGSAFYRGAALLAAEGALRTGAGIVTLASVEPVVGAAVTRLPECCLCPCKEGAQGGIAPENVSLLRRQKATVLLLGPGLGGTAQSAARATETRTLVQQLLPGFAGAAVLDADGLNAAAQLLAEGKPFPHPAGELVVTPAPRRDGAPDRPFGSSACRRPGGHCPAVCQGVERRGSAEGCTHRGGKPGWACVCEPYRQSGACPGRQRGRAGWDACGAAGLRFARLRSRRLRGIPARCRRRPRRCKARRVRDAAA